MDTIINTCLWLGLWSKDNNKKTMLETAVASVKV